MNSNETWEILLIVVVNYVITQMVAHFFNADSEAGVSEWRPLASLAGGLINSCL